MNRKFYSGAVYHIQYTSFNRINYSAVKIDDFVQRCSSEINLYDSRYHHFAGIAWKRVDKTVEASAQHIFCMRQRYISIVGISIL